MRNVREYLVRPQAPPVRDELIPKELTDLPRWVCWRYHWSAKKGKWDKRPYNCRSRRMANITDPQEMSSFEEALACYQDRKRKMHGIGFVLFENDPFSGIDLDRCRRADTGHLQPWAAEIVRQMNTYTEVSPSSEGIRLFIRGKLPQGSRTRRGGIEVYSRGRYLTVTGMHLRGMPITVEERQEKLLWLHDMFIADDAEDGRPSGVSWAAEPTDEDVIAKAKRARNGSKFDLLFEQGDSSAYPSPSEADLALCGMLTYWLGAYATPERVERLFGKSALGTSDKWLTRADYRERTIEQAMRGSRDYYPRERMLIRTTQITQDNQDYAGNITTVPGGSNEDTSPLSPEEEERAVRAAVNLAETEGSLPDWQVMFTLARRLRQICAGKFSVSSFRRAVQAFCDHAIRPAEEYWVAFLLCWRKAFLAEDEDPLAWAFKMAVERPVMSSACYSEYCQQIASVAWYLSQLTGSRPFWLPVQHLASLLNVSPMTVSRAITLLEMDGVIKCVNEYWSYKNHKAKEYIFTGSVALAPSETTQLPTRSSHLAG